MSDYKKQSAKLLLKEAIHNIVRHTNVSYDNTDSNGIKASDAVRKKIKNMQKDLDHWEDVLRYYNSIE